MPVLDIVRSAESPLKELRGVLKPEHPIVILDIVIPKESENLLKLLLFAQVESYPLEAIWQSDWLLGNILELTRLDLAILLGDGLIGEVEHGLLIPEGMLLCQLQPVYEPLSLGVRHILVILELIPAKLDHLDSPHFIDLLLSWSLVFNVTPLGLEACWLTLVDCGFLILFHYSVLIIKRYK